MADTRETKHREKSGSYPGTRPKGTSFPRPARSTSVTPRRTDSPFSMMRRVLEDMDRMFFDFSGGPPPERWSGHPDRTFWAPQIETFRRGDQLVVRADLPGMNKENVNVEVEDDTLLISGERQDEYNEERDDFYRSERSYGSFFRAVPLPDGIDPNSAKAEFKDGVLEVTVTVPKAPEQKGRRIDIR